jgi:hypothetical protein
MDAQQVTLGVALLGLAGTLAAQALSAFVTYKSKVIDEKQKSEDRKQELRKIYLAKKIEAGEEIISASNFFIAEIRYHEGLIAAYVKNYGYFLKDGSKKLSDSINKSNNLVYGKSSKHRMYFDIDSLSNETAHSNNTAAHIQSEIIAMLNSLQVFAQGDDGEKFIVIDNNNREAWNAKQQELIAKLEQYLLATQKHKQLLIDSCAAIRNQLAKYELTE